MNKAGLIDDPYVMQEQGIHSVDWQDWPRVEYPDVYNHLIQTPSIYTGDSLRAYKSLDGYNFCVNGWVSNVSVLPIMHTPNAKLTIASVKHSQRLSGTPLKLWIAAKMESTIICGHCTCMTGLGEACSHIAALCLLPFHFAAAFTSTEGGKMIQCSEWFHDLCIAALC